MTRIFLVLALPLMTALVSGAPSVADAALIDAPLPKNAYITHNGFEWAWAFPLPPNADFDLSYQRSHGWRIPGRWLLRIAPRATDFLFAGANVPLGGIDPVSGAYFTTGNAALDNDGAVAVPYFSKTYVHADWHDGLGQTYGPWWGMPEAPGFGEQLVVRCSVTNPEPSSIALLGLGALSLVVAWRRGRNRQTFA